MRPKWAKIVKPKDIKKGKLYFLSMVQKPGSMTPQLLWAEGKDGKRIWSEKPGIAIKCKGGSAFKAFMEKDELLVAIEVPKNADRRWRAR